jgi:predicted RNase H-like HicB family nuclease
MIYYCTIGKEGDEYIAQFPDMTNIVTCGFSREEALAMMKEALDGCLEADISAGCLFPRLLAERAVRCLWQTISPCPSDFGNSGGAKPDRYSPETGAFLSVIPAP